MIRTILRQWSVVLLSVHTTEPNTSQQNHQLSLRKRNTCHQYFFLMVIILRSYKNSQRQQELLPTKKEFKSTAVLSYIQGVSEVLRPCLQHQGIRTVFKYDTALRSHLVRPKDALEPTKQNGVVFKIPCECGKVYIGETGISVRKSIKKKIWQRHTVCSYSDLCGFGVH